MLDNYTDSKNLLQEENDKFMELLNIPEDPDLLKNIKKFEEYIDKLNYLGLTQSETYNKISSKLELLNSQVKIKSDRQLSLELIDNLNCQHPLLVLSNDYVTGVLKIENDKPLGEYQGEIAMERVEKLCNLKKFIESRYSLDFIELLNKTNKKNYDKTVFFFKEIENDIMIYQYFPLGILIYKN